MDRAPKSQGNVDGINIVTKPTLVRKQFLITEFQAKELRDMAHHSGKSESELVRVALTTLNNTL